MRPSRSITHGAPSLGRGSGVCGFPTVLDGGPRAHQVRRQATGAMGSPKVVHVAEPRRLCRHLHVAADRVARHGALTRNPDTAPPPLPPALRTSPTLADATSRVVRLHLRQRVRAPPHTGEGAPRRCRPTSRRNRRCEQHRSKPHHLVHLPSESHLARSRQRAIAVALRQLSPGRVRNFHLRRPCPSTQPRL